MLVHIKLLKCNEEYDDWDYESATTIAFYKVKSYDKFLRFIQSLKKSHGDMIIGSDWYTVEDYALNFPTDKDSVPCFYVYVVG